MAARHDHGAMPAVYRQPHQMRKQLLGAGGDGEVDPVARHQLGDLFGGALVQVQAHLRIAGAERADNLRQHVARLGVGGRDRQAAAVRLAQLCRGAADVLHLAQDAAGAGDDLLARRRGARERPAFTLEQLKSELLLQQLQLPAHAGLGGMQLPRGRGDVQTVFVHCDQIAQLLELHEPDLHILASIGAWRPASL